MIILILSLCSWEKPASIHNLPFICVRQQVRFYHEALSEAEPTPFPSSAPVHHESQPRGSLLDSLQFARVSLVVRVPKQDTALYV